MSTEPPDFDSDEGFDDPELQAEHDRLLAAIEAKVPPRVRLAPDLEELLARIGDVTAIRSFGHTCPKPYMFRRFEAYSVRRGGMGLVIEAIDPHLERKVAIKLWMRSGIEAQLALTAEAKTLAKLRHPNVVTIYEPGVWNDRVYFVMEWIEGVDGHDWMETPRTWQEILAVYIAAGTGLAAAHDSGIQHRDFKPSNILIGNDGNVVVADFGVADSLHAIPDAEESGRIAGTPSYMAPERLRGKRGDARSDQYSFCVAIWQAMFGQRPFEGRTGEELLESIERGDVRETPGVDVPEWLRRVLRRGLAADPSSRFRDMHELLDALRSGPPDAPVDGVGRDDDDVVALGGRVLHKPRAGWTSRWHYFFVLGVLTTLGAVAGFRMVATPEPPVPVAKDIEPFDAILGLISRNEFERALQLWHDHKSELTDEESLEVGRSCLEKAKQLAGVDDTKAEEAVRAAHEIARVVETTGTTPAAQRAGGQLAADTMARARQPPATSP